MEWSMFLITMGMLMAFGFIGIGVCIGEGLDKRELCKCDSGSDVSGGDPNLRDSAMGDSDRAEHSGQDMGSDVPSPEEISRVLWVLRLGASATEKRVIDHLIRQEGCDNE